MKVIIKNISVSKVKDKYKLSGLIGKEELWFECKSGHELFCNIEPFICAAIIPAMFNNEDIDIESDIPVSELFLQNLDEIQNILTLWFSQLSKIKIHASNINEKTHDLSAGVASFFSGGVDGTYTFLKNINEITHLVFIEGIDIHLKNKLALKKAQEKNFEYLKSKNKEIVIVRSNIRYFFTDKGFTWNMAIAAGLSAVAHAFAFNKVYIAGSQSAQELMGDGSHPILDYLFSTEKTKIVHDGIDIKRIDKLLRISKDLSVLEMLRVCWHDEGYNCGKCEKCLRTMITLRLLGINTSTFPTLDSVQPIKSLRLQDQSQLLFLRENLELAENVGDEELYQVLLKVEKQYMARKALVNLDYAWFGGRCKRIFNKVF